MKQFLKRYWPYFVFVGFAVATIFISLMKHDALFQTFGNDLGFYDQIIYKAGIGDFSKSTIATVTSLGIKLSFWENDFHPVLLVFAALSRIFPGASALLVAQSLLAVAMVIPLYWLAKFKTKSQLFAFAISFACLTLVTQQHAIFDGFTPEIIGAGFLSLFFYSWYTDKRNLIFVSVLGMILSKVEFAPVVAIFGVTTMVFERKYRLGLTLLLVGASAFIFLVYFLNPFISPGYRNYAHYSLGYGDLGSNPQEIVLNAVKNPGEILASLVWPPVKTTAVFSQLSQFAFLPLFGVQMLPLLLYEYAVRFINTVMMGKWTLHSFALTPILATAAILGYKNISKRVPVTVVSIFLITASLVGDLAFHGPLNSLFKPQFYRQESWAKDNHKIIASVPSKSSVATINSLAPHLSSRKAIYILPEYNNAEYIAVDWHNGPNAYSPASYESLRKLVGGLIDKREYRVIKQEGQAMVLQRI